MNSEHCLVSATFKACPYACKVFFLFRVRGSIMFPERASAQGSRLVVLLCRGSTLERRRIYFVVNLRVFGVLAYEKSTIYSQKTARALSGLCLVWPIHGVFTCFLCFRLWWKGDLLVKTQHFWLILCSIDFLSCFYVFWAFLLLGETRFIRKKRHSRSRGYAWYVQFTVFLRVFFASVFDGRTIYS